MPDSSVDGPERSCTWAAQAAPRQRTYAGLMGLFSRLARRRGSTSRTARPGQGVDRAATLAHFRDFQATRAGVEAYIEPATRTDPTTVILIARTGEWTRRRVPDVAAARTLARELGMPVYDVQLTGYPARMRDWNASQQPDRARVRRR